MAIVRWDPLRALDAFDQEANRLFNAVAGQQNRSWLPPMDLLEREDHYLVRADLPGLAEENVELQVDKGVLTISGERRAEERAEEEGYVRLERSYGSFTRSLTLPDGVDLDAIEANFDRGVLEVLIPKPEQAQPRRISVGRRAETIEA